MQVAIFKSNEIGAVGVLYVAPEYADQIEAVAARDIPDGCQYRFIDASELPDRATRDRWRWTDDGPIAVGEAP